MSDNPEIPEDAVVAAAGILVAHPFDLPQVGPDSTTRLSETATRRAMTIAEDALAAALPHLRVQETPVVSDEELIHEIAVELNNDGAYCGGCDYEGGLSCEDCKRVCEGYARRVALPRIKAARAAPHPRPVVDREAVEAAIKKLADMRVVLSSPKHNLWRCATEDEVREITIAVLALLPTEEGEGS